MLGEIADSELLADLVRVVRRHGPESVLRLAHLIRDPMAAGDLSDVLERAVEHEKSKPKKPKRASSRSSGALSPGSKLLGELRKADPEKHSIVAEMRSYLIAGKVLPTMGELRQFADVHSLSIGKASSRRAAIVPLLKSIAEHPSADAKRLLDLMSKPTANSRSLKEWRDVIVGRPHSRAVSSNAP